MKKDFHIQNIDPLGQGVSKTEGDVTFIKKTLPDESGIAEIITSKKGVTFATLKTLTNKSPDRITPVCSYFEQCNGCDFLHTSYEKEVEFKKFNILRSLKSFGIDDVHFHESRERIGYRNRVQLHFSRSQNKIGYLDVNRKIVNIKNCIIASPLIQKKIKEITERGQWLDLTQKSEDEGHLELYEKEGTVQIAVNQNYAHGGFTQVNNEMNKDLVALVADKVKFMARNEKPVFDLFGGNGNLTKKITNPTLVVDMYKTNQPKDVFHQTFMNLDLYSPKAIGQIARFYDVKPELIIFDPPRSGVKNLNDYLKTFNPNSFIYISCQFSSFIRDSKPSLEQYALTEVHIFDLFPSTHHFETIGLFTKRS